MGENSDTEVVTPRQECLDAGTCTMSFWNVKLAVADNEKKVHAKEEGAESLA